tara:strand:- start:292 stop:462 length:171 start_codon:yes stop_codon:yes gene_type:complete
VALTRLQSGVVGPTQRLDIANPLEMARRTFDESVKAAHHCAIGKLKLALQLEYVPK